MHKIIKETKGSILKKNDRNSKYIRYFLNIITEYRHLSWVRMTKMMFKVCCIQLKANKESQGEQKGSFDIIQFREEKKAL